MRVSCYAFVFVAAALLFALHAQAAKPPFKLAVRGQAKVHALGDASPLQACVDKTNFPFCNTSLSRAARVADLVSRMSLSEKVAQMENMAAGVDRLGVPKFNWWNEALHGIVGPCAPNWHCPTSFPEAINMAGAFNPALFRSVGSALSDEIRAYYNTKSGSWSFTFGMIVWTPNLNIFRDPRWGRGQETPGECPYLSGVYGTQFVLGMQESDAANSRYVKVVATPKHFAVHSLEKYKNQGRRQHNSVASHQDMYQTYLPAFKASVMEGHAHGIMCSYNSVNGAPACANNELLRDILRGQWKFDGYVTGDCGSVQAIMTGHHWKNSNEEAVAAALLAGTDIDCDETGAAFYKNYLPGALNRNLIKQSDIDQALTRLYNVHFSLGMYDPWSQRAYPNYGAEVVDSAAHRSVARQVAREGCVLLKNANNILPIVPQGSITIAAIGPSADTADGLRGNYIGACGAIVTIRRGLETMSGVRVTYEKGCDINSSKRDGIAAAVNAARSANYAVLVVGLDTTIEAEEIDRPDINLPGVQNELIDQVVAAQPKTIIVLVNGGIVGMDSVNKAAAVIEAFYPGEEGGTAVADIIYGRYNPSGRLPVTIYPKEYTGQTDYGSYQMRAGSSGPGRTYRFYTGTPVYEFGFGLSYSKFNYDISPKTQLVDDANPTATYTVTVTNAGPRDGDVSVLGFLSLVSDSTTPSAQPVQLQANKQVDQMCPIKQLFSFQKISGLKVGESRSLTFTISPADAWCVDQNGKRVARPGTYALRLGEGTASFVVNGTVLPTPVDPGTTCGITQSEGESVFLTCPTGATINAINFASYGTPSGDCFGGFTQSSCHSTTSMSLVKSLCLGKPSCTVVFGNDQFGDPCSGTNKRGAVQVSCTAAPIPPSTCAVTVNEGETAALGCPNGQPIVSVDFASYGTPSGDCSVGLSQVASCHSNTSLSIVQAQCIGRTNCSIAGNNDVFGDPCPTVKKHLAAKVTCYVPPPPPPPPAPCVSTTSESQTVVLGCDSKQPIVSVDFASYGTPSGDCSSGFKQSSCHSNTSLSLIAALCVGQPNCSVSASNAVFGDPCAGTNKHLAVKVSCYVPPKPIGQCATSPEGESVVLGGCPAGQLITSVDFASYGAPTGDCSTGFTQSSTCHASTSSSVVQNLCVGKPNCTVAAGNDVFGDPCSGASKRLAVKVTCGIPKPPAPAAPCVLTTAEGGSVSIGCPDGQVVSAVDFASYGTPTGNCSVGFKQSTCHSTSSVSVVHSRCVGQQSCSVVGGNDVFGDPCSGTSKRLAVKVLCGTAPAGTCSATASENDVAAVGCPSGQVIGSVDFASYGTPTGDCSTGFKQSSSCHSSTSLSVVQARCVGQPSCTIPGTNDLFGDPCATVNKRVAVKVSCK